MVVPKALDYRPGATCFPELDIAHVGTTGDALLFTNVDSGGKLDERKKHAGLPPVTGKKLYIFQMDT